MNLLPDRLRPFKRTEVFTRDTVPAGLLNNHATKAGVWGLIHVIKGGLVYRIKGSSQSHPLGPRTTGIIAPQILHSLELLGDTEFFVEFWRAEAKTPQAPSERPAT